jgi:hypothetical protein
MDENKTSDELRAAADAADARAEESFQRCDTDGFLSQWADGLEARRLRLAADIAEDGGTSEFLAVFTLDGKYVPARRCESGHYGWNDYWMLLDPDGQATGTFLAYHPARRATLAKKGYVEGIVREPAKAIITGKGTGLSGNAWAAVVPINKPWETCKRTVVTADRWNDPK